MKTLNYYATQSPITDPGPFLHLYDDLPDTPAEIAAVVQGLMIHKLAGRMYNVHFSPQQREEYLLRTAQQYLARIQEYDPAPLTETREPAHRLVGVCRDFAILFISMLRHKDIPARMRVGFADYFDPVGPIKSDHWIGEFWDKPHSRWVLADPQLDPLYLKTFRIEADPMDLSHDKDFYLAGSAWRHARAGRMKSTFFRYSGLWKGFPCIRGNLLHDFQSLNKIELTVMDYWDKLSTKNERDLTVDDKAVLDHIADLTMDSDAHFDEMQAYFESMPRTQIIRDRLRTLGVISGGQTAALDEIQESGASRLAAMSGENGSGEVPEIRIPTYVPYDLGDDHPAILSAGRISNQLDDIRVRGARQHNLRNIDVRIPRHKLVVVTGVSGSGKSSLAFDTIYAEGQRRYVESLSSYARQFMGQMEKPKVDQITGLSPAIAIEQKTVSKNPRSTVGTVTEILDYLRVLYARIGVPHCPNCGRAVQPQTSQQITHQLAHLPPGTRFQLLAPIIRNRKGEHKRLIKQAVKDGYTRAQIDGEMYDLLDEASLPELDKKKKHHIELVVDRLVVPDKESDDEVYKGAQSKKTSNLSDLASDFDDWNTRLADSVETTLRAAEGQLIVVLDRDEIILSEHNACPHCDISFPELQPQMFSFNSAFGMCPDCNGLGVKLQIDPELIIVNPEISLLDGASAWHGNMRKKKESSWSVNVMYQLARHYEIDLEKPWNELPEEFRHVLMFGSGDRKLHFRYEGDHGTWESDRPTSGLIYHINRLFRQTRSEYRRRWYTQFMSKLPCPTCEGERLCPEARFTTVDNVRLPEMTGWSIEAVHEWLERLPESLDQEERKIADELIAEIYQRVGFLRNVGLHYLTLDRPAPTLSGGEGQRIRLASQIGSGLVGVLYILDEPSIGLHTRDHRALLDTLTHLRDIGNTVLVVEHDADTMRAADWLIDLGPGPGVLGGTVVSAGTPDQVMGDPDSLTGRYLTGEKTILSPNARPRTSQDFLTIKGARLHNLKSIEAHFPLGVLTVVTGVSGSGKSSLIAKTLHPALARTLHSAQAVPGDHDRLLGLDQIDKVINITQSPIGRNPRSNPGTYSQVMGEIRKVFATTTEAKARGYKAGRFSMNTKGGRCEDCKGYGVKRVEMHFLSDVYVRCATCNGLRFNRQTLEILYKGRTIADVLEMDVQEALSFFANHPKIARILQTLHDVGLDYMKLGQSALTLSGGEAQRVKLAKELSRVATGRTVYFLDEPTTGLHFGDIQRLLDVLHRLVDAGNTVIVIEHNMEVIKSADWIIDLGPEGGEKGGYIVAEGTPETVAATEGSYTGQFLREVVEREVNREKAASKQVSGN